jgi:preprotein translocase subunit SecE
MNGATNTTKRSPAQFLREVRQEAAKVTWPTRKETLITTAMVFAMSILAAIFFFVVDYILSHAVRFVLGLGG